jgi:hypothetical protein
MVSILWHLVVPTMAPRTNSDLSVRQDKGPKESVLGVQEEGLDGSLHDDKK